MGPPFYMYWSEVHWKSFDGQGALKTEYSERVDPYKHWSEPQYKFGQSC